MKTTHTEHLFLVINEKEENMVTYARNSTEAAKLAGCPEWDWFFPAKAIHHLENGDELNLSSYASVIRITGKEIDYRG